MMPNKKFTHVLLNSLAVIGFLLLPIIWIFIKYVYNIPDRYLPSPIAVFKAINDLEPSLWMHSFITLIRLISGITIGILFGIFIGILLTTFENLKHILYPMVQSIRAIPPIATIPFFLVWFGFSEIGKLIIIVFGISFNIAIATIQAIHSIPERYIIMFKSFGLKTSSLPFSYCLPASMEVLGPTIRFSLSTAVGLVVASELLGSQIGLGYLIQTSRQTFSMHTIFLATIAIGIIASIIDWVIIKVWDILLFWKKNENGKLQKIKI